MYKILYFQGDKGDKGDTGAKGLKGHPGYKGDQVDKSHFSNITFYLLQFEFSLILKSTMMTILR